MDSVYDLQNGVFRRKDGVYVDLAIKNGKLYSDGVYDRRVVLSNGNIAKEGALNSLKSCVQHFQESVIKREINSSTYNKERSWTIGYYDVSTDEAMIKFLGTDVIHNVSAFR